MQWSYAQYKTGKTGVHLPYKMPEQPGRLARDGLGFSAG
jgi:hypothetical protein